MGTITQVDQNPSVANQHPAVLLDVNSAGAKRHLWRSFEVTFTFCERMADLFTVTSVILLSYHLFPGQQEQFSHGAVWAVGLLFLLMLDREGAYHAGNSLLRVKETERILRVSMQVYLLLMATSLLLVRFCSVRFLTITAALVMLAVIAEKQLAYTVVRGLHARGFGVRKVVIYGAGYSGRRVFGALSRSPKLGLEPLVVVDENPALAGERIYESAYKREHSVPIVCGPLTKELLHEYGAGMVVIAVPSLAREKFLAVLHEATAAGIHVAFIPSNVPSDLWVEHADIDGLLLTSLGSPTERSLYQAGKRMFDIALGVILLLAAAPLWLATMLLIRLDSPGPVLFVQKRVGQNGKLFNLFKFRTMYADSPLYEYSPKECGDPRITPIGRFLRRTSLDELPQLLNVLLGGMSLVGPRPEMPFIVQSYTPMQKQRLQVKPGLTGLWQISADRAFQIHENLEYDLYYLRNRGFFMDVAILLHTFIFAMRGI
jgi:exopolysaccharide biosynthesis polyprenyl glycosylphosphotransferase